MPAFLAERYEDVRFLGEGGMGAVYQAIDPRLGRRVAIKVLKGFDPELAARILTEARAQAQVDHENVCRVYEAGEVVAGQPFIEMQYIDGRELSDVASELTLEQRVRVLQQIAMAVHEAHRLGIIHRDIKPTNILVERRESGALKPYILDFGLARQVGERGRTQTGVVVGTLSYMPPEQARGDWQFIDRRSDVFALGATLFEAIAGRPPFEAEPQMRLLFLVTYGDAPRLGAVKEGVPPALETIVMKCLEREPEHRYESARALAEDLRRFLDGERIVARPAPLGRRLRKTARRHKVATALLAAVIIACLAFAGVWLRAERRAAERARLAHDLGVRMKEMELFLRAAYALPLHDVERERDLVRGRLAEIADRMAVAGPAGEGPGHSALGQGYLALGDLEMARAHLEKAASLGYSAPELQYALGRALAEMFRRGLAETRRISSEEERARRIAELERQLRDPALGHLRAAAGSKIGVPAYVEGLIALCEGKNAEAAARAREAFERAPWMYEAKVLEGDALFAEGSRNRHDAAFDHGKMMAHFTPSAQAYATAADIGRSDPRVALAECELWEKIGWGAWNAALPSEAAFDAADAACRRSIAASSKDGRALVQRALVLSAKAATLKDERPEEALGAAEEALFDAETSAEARPLDVMAHYAVAVALRQRAFALRELGQDPSMDAAIDAYERVILMDARFAWAWNELGDAYRFEAEGERRRGGAGSGVAERAIRAFEQAIRLDPSFALPVFGRLRTFFSQIEADIERGEDAERWLGAMSAAVAELDERPFGEWLTAMWKSRLHRLRAERELAGGRDPRPEIDAALEAIRTFGGDVPEQGWLHFEKATCHLLAASHAVGADLDPTPALELAATSAERARERGMNVESLTARLEALSLRSRAKGPRGDGDRGARSALATQAR